MQRALNLRLCCVIVLRDRRARAVCEPGGLRAGLRELLLARCLVDDMGSVTYAMSRGETEETHLDVAIALLTLLHGVLCGALGRVSELARLRSRLLLVRLPACGRVLLFALAHVVPPTESEACAADEPEERVIRATGLRDV